MVDTRPSAAAEGGRCRPDLDGRGNTSRGNVIVLAPARHSSEK